MRPLARDEAAFATLVAEPPRRANSCIQALSPNMPINNPGRLKSASRFGHRNNSPEGVTSTFARSLAEAPRSPCARSGGNKKLAPFRNSTIIRFDRRSYLARAARGSVLSDKAAAFTAPRSKSLLAPLAIDDEGLSIYVNPPIRKIRFRFFQLVKSLIPRFVNSRFVNVSSRPYSAFGPLCDNDLTKEMPGWVYGKSAQHA